MEEHDNHPEMRLDYISLTFVRLTKFKKTIDECESLQDKLIFSLCHAHEFESKPRQLREKLFNRLFDIAKISNFNDMELWEYISRHKARNDRYAEKAYIMKKGMKKLLALWERGVPLAEAKQKLGLR